MSGFPWRWWPLSQNKSSDVEPSSERNAVYGVRVAFKESPPFLAGSKLREETPS